MGVENPYYRTAPIVPLAGASAQKLPSMGIGARAKARTSSAEILRCWLVAALLLSPIMLTESIRARLMPLIESTGCHKETPLMLILLVMLVGYRWFAGQGMSRRHRQVVWVCALFVGVASISFMATRGETTPWLRLIEIIGPILLGMELAVKMRNLGDVARTWDRFLTMFIAYLAFSLVWWWTKLRFIHSADPNLNFVRLNTTLTGPVTLGVLLAVLLPIVIIYITRRSLLWGTSIAGIYCAALLATGTRSAVFMSIPLLGMAFLSPYKKWKLTIGGLALTAIVVVALGLSSDFKADRFGNLETVRTATQVASISAWTQDPRSFLIGKGLNAYYPYDNWFAYTQANSFSEKLRFFRDWNQEDYLLVEPHSLYVWLAVETGLLGLALLLGALVVPVAVKAVRVLIMRRPDTPPLLWALSAATLAILVVSFSGSFMLNEPPIATLAWFILFTLDRWNIAWTK